MVVIALVLQCPSRLAFGGGSFAGVTALMAATTLPDVFGGILVESPSLWVGEGRFLQVGVLLTTEPAGNSIEGSKAEA